jgi:hypothetical protein
LVQPEFAQYIGPVELHDATVMPVTHHGDEVDLEIRGFEGTRISIRFRDVAELIANRSEGMMLYALAEFACQAGLRHFGFQNWDSDDDASLRVIARTVDFAVRTP